jgi:hypothetical protein
VESLFAADEITLDEPLALHTEVVFLALLAPRVDAGVVDGSAVEGVRQYLAVDVTVAKRDIVPTGHR